VFEGHPVITRRRGLCASAHPLACCSDHVGYVAEVLYHGDIEA